MRKLPKFVTIEEYGLICQHLKKEKPCNWKQYYLAFMLAFESGMRLSEIVGWKDRISRLDKGQVDLQSKIIRIISGKGQKDRIVPLPRGFNQNALAMLPLSLSRRALERMASKLGREVLKKDITFHSFRHGFGTHLANQKIPLHQVQILMGHSRLDTTGVYLHANPREAVDNARDVF